jgi:rhodanese-related sulfurtransferase
MEHKVSNPPLTPAELHGCEDRTTVWLLVDVRTPGEYAGLHIDGSHNMPLGGLARHLPALEQLAKGKRVALICRTGVRAQRARGKLKGAGLEDLHVLEGGVVAWQQAGHPLNHGQGGMSLERQVRIAAGFLVMLGVVLGYLVHPGFFGLAGFVGAGLVFAGVTNTCAMGMMLAKLPWNQGAVACPRE